MKILRVEVYGFKDDNIKVTVDFKDRISILYGGNGSGKTTLLKIIHSVLAQKDAFLIKEKVKKVCILYSEGDKITFVSVFQNAEGTAFIWNELLRSSLSNSHSIFIGLQRGLPINYNRISPSMLYEFLLYSNVSKDVLNIDRKDRTKIRLLATDLSDFVNRYRNQDALTKRLIPKGRHIVMETINMDVVEQALVASYYDVKDKISSKIFAALFETFQIAIEDKQSLDSDLLPHDIKNIIIKNKEILIEALDNTPDNGFKGIVIEKLQEVEDNYSLNRLLENLLYKIILELRYEKEELSALNNILELFNEFLGNEKHILVSKSGVSVKCHTSEHSINDLSSGERHLISFLVTLYLDDNKRNFILIDEPEISLNIIWKEKLLSIISQIAPASHVIVASHSQSIAQNHISSLSKIQRAYE